MRTIELQEMTRGSEFVNVRSCLESGGLVCLPCRSSYRIFADLTNGEAVNRLLFSKHRTSKAPSLVFIPDFAMLKRVAGHIPSKAKRLAKQLWPGELTIRFEPNEETIPGPILRPLTKAGGKLGVRVPSEPWILRLLHELDRPLLVSSANREKKHGATSPALIRKNFVSSVSIFVNAGDIPPCPPSTVLDFLDDEVVIKREGSITKSRIDSVLLLDES
ncbi:MAG: L-threonylcarbamoyladenylate synthase [Proteobacteria bacterium]|nr:L-threonylcarbamoyladenylate synthase [Pseudomonadota bacterium]